MHLFSCSILAWVTRDLKCVPEYKAMVKINRTQAKLFLFQERHHSQQPYELVSAKSNTKIYQKGLRLLKSILQNRYNFNYVIELVSRITLKWCKNRNCVVYKLHYDNEHEWGRKKDKFIIFLMTRCKIFANWSKCTNYISSDNNVAS